MTNAARIFFGLAGLFFFPFGLWVARRPRTEEQLRKDFFLMNPPIQPTKREPPTYEQMNRWRTLIGYWVVIHVAPLHRVCSLCP